MEDVPMENTTTEQSQTEEVTAQEIALVEETSAELEPENAKEQTFAKLNDLQHMMGAYRQMAKKEHGPMADASRGKGRVLALLKMKDGIATRDMATVLDIRVSSLNETLARLEKDGYIERKPSEQDGRIMLVYLTDKGTEEEQPKASLADLLFADFDDDALQSLNGHLDLMTEALEKELGEDWREQHENARDSRRRFFDHDRDHGHGGGRGGHGKGGYGRGGHGDDRGGRGGYGKGGHGDDRGGRGGYGKGGHGDDRGGRGGYGRGGHGEERGGRGGFGKGGHGDDRGGRDGYTRGGQGGGRGGQGGGRGGYGKGGHGGGGQGGNRYATRYDLHE